MKVEDSRHCGLIGIYWNHTRLEAPPLSMLDWRLGGGVAKHREGQLRRCWSRMDAGRAWAEKLAASRSQVHAKGGRKIIIPITITNNHLLT